MCNCRGNCPDYDVKPMGTSITCHALAGIPTALKTCLSIALSTTLPYGTILGSVSALLEKLLKNIHTYIWTYKHDLIPFLSIAWHRLRAFGAQPPSESCPPSLSATPILNQRLSLNPSQIWNGIVSKLLNSDTHNYSGTFQLDLMVLFIVESKRYRNASKRKGHW